jgi:rhodanese-related sulfurtransferase
MTRLTTGRILAAAALGLAVLAPVAGGGQRAPEVGVAELTAELAEGDAFIDAVTLGEWIRDRRPVRIWDVRPDSGAFVRFAVPTASHVPFRDLASRAPDPVTIVVYDDGAGAAIRSWLLLRRLGHSDVRILERGVVGWIDSVVSPVLPAGTPEERERYQRVAAVSRYFGGLPRVGEPSASAGASAEEAVQLLSRRGCY